MDTNDKCFIVLSILGYNLLLDELQKEYKKHMEKFVCVYKVSQTSVSISLYHAARKAPFVTIVI